VKNDRMKTITARYASVYTSVHPVVGHCTQSTTVPGSVPLCAIEQDLARSARMALGGAEVRRVGIVVTTDMKRIDGCPR